MVIVLEIRTGYLVRQSCCFKKKTVTMLKINKTIFKTNRRMLKYIDRKTLNNVIGYRHNIINSK